MGRAAPIRHERSVSVRAQPDVPRGRIGCAWRSHRIRVAAALHLSRRPHWGLALLRCAVRGADALTTVRCGLRGVPSACRSLGPKDTVSVLSVQAVAKRFGEREAEMHRHEPRLGSGEQELLERYSEAQHQFEHAGGYDFEATVGRVLDGLGLDALRNREVATLSGGERTRLGLARLLLDDPDILLLDEPTNHLDVAALEWLERFLIEKDETILVSSHDRWFLDRVTGRTLSFEKKPVVEYRSGY